MISDVKFYYTYSEQEQLIETSNTNKSYSLYTGELESEYEGNHKIFNYFCDGLLQSEQEEYKGKIQKELRYYYQFGDNCIDRKGEDVFFKFHPNPVDNQLFINSEALFSEDCYLTLTNSKGQLVYSRMVGERVDSLNISLKDLDAGIYFVTLYWEDQRTTRQIVKR